MNDLSRRKFLQKSSLSAAFLATGSKLKGDTSNAYNQRSGRSKYMGNFTAPKLNNIRIALIGAGARGPGHLKFTAELYGTEIVAISDLYEDLVKKCAMEISNIGKGQRHKNIATYFGDKNMWRTMLSEVKPDIVFIATNWSNHALMAIEAMNQGAHTFVEVPLAVTLEEMWKIIDTSEHTHKHCMMMENVNYGREELMYLNMCRQGIIGELLHGEAAYIHDLRFQMIQQNRGTGSWRTHQYAKRNGNLYPTHGLGPIAQYMNIGRTQDNFDSLVSFSTPTFGRQNYAKKNYPSDHKWNQLKFVGGDMNTSIIKTIIGRTIMIQWDETSPRPYTRLNLIQGTKGCLAGYPTRIALEGGVEGLTKDHHSWVQGAQLEEIFEKYDHPLYQRMNALAKNSGHGGMDGIMLYRIVECLQKGLPLDQNVYEGCLWSAVGPLSEKSVKEGGTTQSFPDFTRGSWRNTTPLEIMA